MMTHLRFWRGIFPVVLLCAGSLSAHGATTITWDGNGVSGGTGSTFWDNNATGNWNGGSGSNAAFGLATTTLDFGAVAVGGTYTFGTAASTVQTINVFDLTFANASTVVTPTTTASTIILNGDNGGTAQGTNDVTLSLADNIYVGPPGAALGSGQLAVLGADVTLSLTSALHNFGAFAPGFSGATGPLSGTTIAGASALLINSRITNATFSSNAITLGNSGAFGNAGTGTPPPGTSDRVSVILANDSNSFDAPIITRGNVFYTSISNIGGGNSALGSPSSAASTITVSNNSYFGYVGTADQTVTRNILYGSNSGIFNDSAAPTTIDFQSLTATSASAGQLRVDSANTGDVLKISSVLANNAGGAVMLVIGGYDYYDNLGVYHTSSSRGAVLLTGANTFTGGVQLNAGNLQIGNASALGTGLFAIATNTTFDNVSGSDMTLSTNNAQSWVGNFTFLGTKSLNMGTGNVALINANVTVNANTLAAGGVVSGTTTLVKKGNGTLVLGGANTMSGGATVSAGSLLIANTSGSGTGTGTVTVSAGGIFGGTGIAAPTVANKISVAEGGAIAPGGVNGAAIGTLTIDGGGNTSTGLLTMGTAVTSSAAFDFDLGASNASDKIVFLNFVTTDLVLHKNAFNFTGTQAGQFELFDFYSDGGSTLTADGLSAASFNLLGSTGLSGYTATLDFSTTGKVFLDVSAVPEPSTWALLAGGAAALFFFSRRVRRAARA